VRPERMTKQHANTLLKTRTVDLVDLLKRVHSHYRTISVWIEDRSDLQIR